VPLGPLDVREIRAWAHEVDPGGESQVLAATALLRSRDGESPQEMPDGELVLDVGDDPGTLELRLPRVSPGGRR
jgi:hypothetical protein